MSDIHPSVAHMEREFHKAGLLSGTSGEEELLIRSLRALMGTYANLGLSGGTAPTVLKLFDRLVNGFPLTPLTGEADEWAKPEGGPEDVDMLQNIRCGRVFKMPDGSCVDMGAKPVYVTPDGSCVTRSTDEAPEVTFPYMPGFPPMIRVDAKGNPIP